VKHCQSHSSDSATHWHGHGPTFCSSFTAFPPTNNEHKLQFTDVHAAPPRNCGSWSLRRCSSLICFSSDPRACDPKRHVIAPNARYT